MRKITVKLEIEVKMVVNEGIDISEIINELDYEINDTTTDADIVDTEIIDYKIIDSK